MTTRTQNDLLLCTRLVTCCQAKFVCCLRVCLTRLREKCLLLCGFVGMCCSHEERLFVATRHTKGVCTVHLFAGVCLSCPSGFVCCLRVCLLFARSLPNRQETGHSQFVVPTGFRKVVCKVCSNRLKGNTISLSPPCTGLFVVCRKPAMPKLFAGFVTVVCGFTSLLKLRICHEYEPCEVCLLHCQKSLSMSISSPQMRQETISTQTRLQGLFHCLHPSQNTPCGSPLSSPRLRVCL